MKIALIALLLTYIGCQDYNSNTFDQDRYGEIELTGSGDLSTFRAAYPILQKRCMNCHRHAQWAGYTDKNDWVTNENLVVPDDEDGSQSQVLYRIKNFGGTSSDMPQGGSQLPAEEYEALKAWVTGY